ncbi:fasciclin domain-containing protein [uncultured Stenotrophomonas sp.]|uniref:fasciclin domain-containing protein n=1 Tax=uncultured Stenotrophomonas sp. TaxID=165438 RepID=UPI0028E63674|nr:fasciclin domain-containing protein [uncultured Stenotrophomonas sp.]
MYNSIRRLAMASCIAAACLVTVGASAAENPMVGGAAMYPTKTIVENASAAKNLTTLVAAVKAAGLAETLSGAGPFTVFAPTNDAFAKLPKGTVDTLLKPENKAKLTKILTYHVVPGTHSAAELTAAAKKGGMASMLTTVQGEKLTVKVSEGKVWVVDAMGGKAAVTTADVGQSNGVVHVIDTVLMPK